MIIINTSSISSKYKKEKNISVFAPRRDKSTNTTHTFSLSLFSLTSLPLHYRSFFDFSFHLSPLVLFSPYPHTSPHLDPSPSRRRMHFYLRILSLSSLYLLLPLHTLTHLH